MLWLAGCASVSGARPGTAGASVRDSWSGRLSLRVDSSPVQTFSALFDLRGTAEAGELALTTPLGNTLAVLHWAPGEALLKNGSTTRRFDSVDALAEAATGAAIPVAALFDWLAGREGKVPGWQVDLNQFADGRLHATRQSPQPTADLRIILDSP
jgi:outer membrane lipoprotein LolB